MSDCVSFCLYAQALWKALDNNYLSIMKRSRLSILVILAIFIAGCHLPKNPEEGFIKNGEYTQPLIEWKMKIPAGYDMSGLDDFKKGAMSESFGQLQKENGAIPFSRIKDRTDFRKDHYNFFSITLFNFNSTEEDWKSANQKTKIRNYLTFENYGSTIDSTNTKSETVNGRKTLVYEFMIRAKGSQPALHQRFYSCFIKKYDFNIVFCSDNPADDKALVSALRNSEWTQRME
jgi:hypothetical protein